MSRRTLVLADDLTGAAEVGGIAASRGLSARIVMGRTPVPADVPVDVVVLDTNTRHLAAAEAAAVLAEVGRNVPWDRFSQVYKKVDSALRGPVVAELSALLDTGRWRRAALLPQNPSRGRTILHGHYLIDGVPLHRTFMASDPEHPADSSDVLNRLGRFGQVPLLLVTPGAELPTRGIGLCEAADLATIQHRADQLETTTLPAGGADFFRAVLSGLGGTSSAVSFRPTPPDGVTLVVCGSACQRSRSDVAAHAAAGGTVVDFPHTLCDGDGDGDGRAAWARELAGRLRDFGTVWVAARGDVVDGWAARLRAAMADAVVRALEDVPAVGRLLIEGGATGAAIAARAGWTALSVDGELAPGVVSVRPHGPGRVPAGVVLKPGSYAWPAAATPGSGRTS